MILLTSKSAVSAAPTTARLLDPEQPIQMVGKRYSSISIYCTPHDLGDQNFMAAVQLVRSRLGSSDGEVKITVMRGVTPGFSEVRRGSASFNPADDQESCTKCGGSHSVINCQFIGVASIGDAGNDVTVTTSRNPTPLDELLDSTIAELKQVQRGAEQSRGGANVHALGIILLDARNRITRLENKASAPPSFQFEASMPREADLAKKIGVLGVEPQTADEAAALSARRERSFSDRWGLFGIITEHAASLDELAAQADRYLANGENSYLKDIYRGLVSSLKDLRQRTSDATGLTKPSEP